jgi:hypothetical protein
MAKRQPVYETENGRLLLMNQAAYARHRGSLGQAVLSRCLDGKRPTAGIERRLS